MSDHPQGPGWWQAADDNWYPPERHPNYVAPATAAAPPVPPPQLRAGWWQAADDNWYPPERHPNYVAPATTVAPPVPPPQLRAGWWQAADDNWYPPERHPNYVAPATAAAAALAVPPEAQRPGWWQAADDNWYPPERHPDFAAATAAAAARAQAEAQARLETPSSVAPAARADDVRPPARPSAASRAPLAEPQRRPRWRTALLVVAALVAVVVVVRWVSSDDPAASPGPDTSDSTALGTTPATEPPVATAATVPPPTAEAPADPADLALAQASLLVLADFPAGWTETPDDGSDDGDLAVNQCLGLPGDDLLDAGTAMAETGDFAGPTGDQTVGHTVGITATVDEAVASMAILARPDVPTCLQAAIRTAFEQRIANPPTPEDALPPGTTLGEITVERLTVTPVGEQVDGFRITVPINVDGGTLAAYLDNVFVRSGRGIASVTFSSPFTPWAPADIDQWVAVAAGRLAAAQSPAPSA